MTMTLTLFLCLGSGLLAGVFFAFSNFVMQALAGLPASQGIAAMQQINLTVLNPGFLGLFFGTAGLAVLGVAAAVLAWPDAHILLLASLAYLLGGFAVTALCNVPRNERLAGLAADSPEALAYWPQYLSQWLFWNHVRSFACLASAACAALALLG
jgi:uncharacterized membrane protein